MAVQQISQIQIRRGLLQDLGQLASGEFGWALDQLRLFIGNGSLLEGAPYEGNTEIMTKNGVLNIINTALGATGSSGASGATGSTGAEIGLFYRFKGLEGGYEAQTGVDPNNHTIRSLQNKLDDIINVLDFGAVGDDITDDLDAIQRAIDQVYNRLENYTDEKTRRVIHFHPGIYKIYGELRIPPYCVLRGAGKDSVVIKQASPAATCVIKTTTSEGNYDSFIPTEGEPPGPVEISNITFEFNTMPGKSIARIESSRNVKFHRCKFTSSTIQPSVDDNDVAIRIQSNYLTTSAIHFSECDIQGVSTGVLISDNYRIQDIVFDRCTFTDLYQGIVAYTNKSYAILGLKVVNCIFDAIKAYGILGFDNVCGITSSTNTYLNVGTNFTSNISSPLGQPMPRYSIRGDSIYNDIMVSDVDSGDGFNLNITSIDLIETLVYRIVDWVDSSPEHLDRGNLVMSSYEPTLNNHTPITPVIKFSGNACFSFGDFFFRSRDDDYLVDTIEHTASDIISFDLTSAIKYGETYQTIGRSVVLQPNTVNFIPLLSKYFGGIIDYRVERFSRYRSGTVNFSVDPINNIVCWRDSFTERFSTAVFIEMEYNNFLSQTRVQRPILIVKVDNTDGPTIFSYDVKGLVDDNIGLPDLSIPWIRPPAVYALLATADCSVEGAGFILKITGKNVPDCANGRRFKITANANNLDLPLGSGYYIVARQTIDLDYLLTEAGPGTTIFFSVHSLDRYENLIYSIEDYSSGSSLPPTTTGYEHIFDTNVLPTTVDVKVREDFKTEGLEQVEFKLYTWCIGDPESTDAVAEDCALICDTSLTPPITPTPSPTPSISPSPAPTITPKPTPTPSRSIAPTPTPSMSSLPTPTPTPTATATRTPTPTPTSTPSLSPGVSSTPAPTPSPTASSTPTPTPTATPSQSAGATPTPTPTRTNTPTPTPTRTNTPTPSPTRSNTPTPTPTRSKSCDIVPTISISGTQINAKNSCAQDNTILTLTVNYNRPISALTNLKTNTPYMASCLPGGPRLNYRGDLFNDGTALQPINAPGSSIIFWGPEIVSGTQLRYKFSASSSSTPGTYTIKMAPGGRAVTPGQCQNGLSFFESNSVTVTITK